jgi:hypothetical protein
MPPSSTQLVTIVASERIGVSPAPNVESGPENELALITDAVLGDHAALDRTVVRLRELCMALAGDHAAAGTAAAALIEEFESQLLPHFVAEEADEFFGSLVAEEPRLLQLVERLEAQHEEMADTLDDLLRFALSRPPGPELASRLNQFLDRFDEHEHAENALLQDSLLLDEGGGGQ